MCLSPFLTSSMYHLSLAVVNKVSFCNFNMAFEWTKKTVNWFLTEQLGSLFINENYMILVSLNLITVKSCKHNWTVLFGETTQAQASSFRLGSLREFNLNERKWIHWKTHHYPVAILILLSPMNRSVELSCCFAPMWCRRQSRTFGSYVLVKLGLVTRVAFFIVPFLTS